MNEERKKSKRTGRKMGQGKTFYVTLTARDKDRHVSHLWEIVKKFYSQQGETAPVICERGLLKGLTAELDEILVQKNLKIKEELEKNQGYLFDMKGTEQNERT